MKKDIAELCKGSTTDSDSVCLGSNPSSAAIHETSFALNCKRGFLLFGGKIWYVGYLVLKISVVFLYSLWYNEIEKHLTAKYFPAVQEINIIGG